MEYVWLVVGFVLLIKGADFFVDGSSSLARLLRVPSVIIGLTIVAMGTSAPEASVSMSAALSGSNEIALSNVIGSNIFNGLVVVGICAFMAAFSTNKDILKRDLPLNILITFILCILLANGVLSRLEGILLLIGMTAYLISMVISALKNRQDEENGKVLSLPKSLLYIAGGLIAVIAGGNLVVDNACIIAESFGVSQNFIGLTIIAVGTSLPELVTSIVATRKGDSGLALGNAIGSNIFNILFVLGIAATISPITFIMENVIDHATCCPVRIRDRLHFTSAQCHSAVYLCPQQKVHVQMGRRGMYPFIYRLYGISVCAIIRKQISVSKSRENYSLPASNNSPVG